MRFARKSWTATTCGKRPVGMSGATNIARLGPDESDDEAERRSRRGKQPDPSVPGVDRASVRSWPLARGQHTAFDAIFLRWHEPPMARRRLRRSDAGQRDARDSLRA